MTAIRHAGSRTTLAALLTLAPILALAEANAIPSPPQPAEAAALTSADVNAWLDGYLPYALKTGDIAGAEVAVVKDGQIVTERGFGYADVAAKKPVDPKLTLFRPGSVSKLFTWTAVMQLVEQGKIDLDADVNQYLDFKIPPRDGKPFTMRNLLQHTAGFEEQAKGTITESTSPSYEALLKAWVPERVFAPGSTPAYSNYGASLAGYIVQRVSGESFDDYMDRHIFEPLEMKHSSFRQPLPEALAPLMSKGYRVASGEPGKFEIVGPAPAGSLSSPAEDMAHFMIAHLQGGEYQGKHILSAATAETMHNSPLTLLPPLNRMELGFFETNVNGREVIGHLGDTQYFHTSLHLFLKENVGFYVSFNSLGKDGAAGGLRSALFQDFADRYFPAVLTQTPAVDAKAAARDGALLAGSWANTRGSQSNFLAFFGFLGQTKVAVDPKGELVIAGLKDLSSKPRHWVEVEPFVWKDVNSHDRLAAKVVDGRPVRWSFDLLSPFMVFERVPWYANSTWLKPLLYASIAALALTVIFWPVNAIVRRRFRAPLHLDPAAFKAYRFGKLGALWIIAGLALWLLLITQLLRSVGAGGAGMDLLILLTQLFGTLAFFGGLVLVLWNLRAVWRGTRRWPAKLWSVVLTVSAVTVLWVALVFKLVSFGVHY
jgi:CubicO group peptidase (beta-lactamase class C family)